MKGPRQVARSPDEKARDFLEPQWDCQCLEHETLKQSKYVRITKSNDFDFDAPLKKFLFQSERFQKPGTRETLAETAYLMLPSGKLSHNYGKSPFSSWLNPLFRLGHGFNSKLLVYISLPEGTHP